MLTRRNFLQSAAGAGLGLATGGVSQVLASTSRLIWRDNVRLPVTIDERYGFMDREGHLIVPAVYDEVCEFHEGLAKVKRDGRYRFIDASGSVVIPPGFDDAGIFSEGFVGCHRDAHWGYIDRTGLFAIPPRFDEVGNFHEGFAPVRTRDHWGAIDQTGRFVIPPISECRVEFREGMASGIIEFRLAFFDTNGRQTFSFPLPKFKRMMFNGRPKWLGVGGRFSEGLAVVIIDGKWGYVNRAGQVAIKPGYTQAGQFFGGLAIVDSMDKGSGGIQRFFYIDKRGTPQFGGARFITPQYFHEGVAFVGIEGRGGKREEVLGINRKGTVILRLDSDCVGGDMFFSEGLARLIFRDRISGIYNDGYIDKTGKVVIRLEENTCGHSFKNGIAEVSEYHSNWVESYYIDKAGQPIGVFRKKSGREDD